MKPWWKSKTIWFNAAAGGVGFLANQIQPISHHLPDWAATAYGAIVVAANVGLRFITTDPIIQQKLDQ